MHMPKLCPDDETPLTRTGLCTKCGGVFDRATSHDDPAVTERSAAREAAAKVAVIEESSPGLDLSAEAGAAPAWTSGLRGDVSLKPLDRLPERARALDLPLDSLGDVLAGSALELVSAAHRAPQTVYRIVPSKELAQGIADSTLRYASPSNGDASVLIKDAKTGRYAGQAGLERARPSKMAVLGPVAWQALAIATQQHFLTEITTKLESIERGIDNLAGLIRALPEGELQAIIDDVDVLEASLDGGLVNDYEVERIRDRLHEINVVRRQIMKQGFDQLLASTDRFVDPRPWQSDVDLALVALRTHARLADMRLRTEPAARRALAIASEQERFLGGVAEMRTVAAALIQRDDELRDQDLDHRLDREEHGKVKRFFNDKVVRDRSKLQRIRIGAPPAPHRPLPLSRREPLEALAAPVAIRPPELILSFDGERPQLLTG